jgi:hypothetical protein
LSPWIQHPKIVKCCESNVHDIKNTLVWSQSFP